jgi:hypothetical protein
MNRFMQRSSPQRNKRFCQTFTYQGDGMSRAVSILLERKRSLVDTAGTARLCAEQRFGLALYTAVGTQG